MRKDVYDADDELWALWDSSLGYLCPWLTKKEYERWWKLQYGVIGRSLPGRDTIYRTEADEKEKIRREHSKRSQR